MIFDFTRFGLAMEQSRSSSIIRYWTDDPANASSFLFCQKPLLGELKLSFSIAASSKKSSQLSLTRLAKLHSSFLQYWFFCYCWCKHWRNKRRSNDFACSWLCFKNNFLIELSLLPTMRTAADLEQWDRACKENMYPWASSVPVMRQPEPVLLERAVKWKKCIGKWPFSCYKSKFVVFSFLQNVYCLEIAVFYC